MNFNIETIGQKWTAFKERHGLTGHKKGNVGVVVIGIVFSIGILAAVALLVLSSFQDQMVADSAAFNATGLAITAIVTTLGLLGVVGIVGMAALVLQFVNTMGFFGGGGRR
jgi:hypothetical protein